MFEKTEHHGVDKSQYMYTLLYMFNQIQWIEQKLHTNVDSLILKQEEENRDTNN
ncbi:MAG TPA: hypothetical protein VK136_02435 [Bacillota bacterium]|nr:hypothetical protein [Bacillota bacterium]